MNLKAILIDLDGTICKFNIDYREAHKNSINYLISIGLKDKNIIQERSLYNILKKLKKKFPEKKYKHTKKKLYDCFQEIETEAAHNSSLIEGVSKTIHQLKAIDLKLAVVTNNNRIATEKTLGKFDLTNIFDTIITRDDVENLKPDSDSIKKALSHLEVIPNETIFVGDSIADMMAANANNILSVGVLTGPTKKEALLKSNPDYIFDSINNIWEII